MLTIICAWVYIMQHQVLQAPHHCNNLFLLDTRTIHYTMQNVSEIHYDVLSEVHSQILSNQPSNILAFTAGVGYEPKGAMFASWNVTLKSSNKEF